MFQFPAFAPLTLCIRVRVTGSLPLGFPIQRSRDQRLFASFPGLIAGYHVFRRLSMPRHPPCTLSNLTTFTDARICWASRHAGLPIQAQPEAGKGHFHRIRCSTIAPTSLPARLLPGDGKTHLSLNSRAASTNRDGESIAVCSTFRTFRIHLSKSRLITQATLGNTTCRSAFIGFRRQRR